MNIVGSHPSEAEETLEDTHGAQYERLLLHPISSNGHDLSDLSPSEELEMAESLNPRRTSPSFRTPLFTSHFLSTWNSRVIEFGAILFLASIFPGTLLPASIYALTRSASAIVFSPVIGRNVDHGHRLSIVRLSIVGQRLAVVISCGLFWILSTNPTSKSVIKWSCLGILSVLACIEKLCSIMNLVAVERDWVVVLSQGNEEGLRSLNSQMRRIDLFCKLFGPLAISLVDGFSTDAAIRVTLGTALTSVFLEYYMIARVYNMSPNLRRSHPPANNDTCSPPGSPDADHNFPCTSLIPSFCHPRKNPLFLYIQHSAFLPSLSLSILYLTVLSFGGQMTTYLLSTGYTSLHIGLIRTVSVAFEISGTWIAPRVMARIGPVRAGIWFVNWQLLWVAVAVGLFWMIDSPVLAATGLVAGVALSRVGLWGFDLSVQVIVQEHVESQNRGTFSSIEASFQNAFELCSYLSTIVFARPDQFRFPVLVSLGAVCVAGVLYAAFVRKSRGHLLHASRCMGGKGWGGSGGERGTGHGASGRRWDGVPLFEALDG